MSFNTEIIKGFAASYAKSAEFQTAPTVTKPEDTNLFDDFNNWQNQHADNLLYADSYEEYLESDEAKALGLEYDFMEGKDPSNPKEYDEQTLKLAQGNIETLDKDGDGELSIDEYFFTPETIEEMAWDRLDIQKFGKQYEDLDDMLADNYAQRYIEASTVLSIFDKEDFGGDDNGKFSAEELQKYIQCLDGFHVDSDDRSKDGKIGLDESSTYPSYLAAQVNTPDSIKQSATALFKEMLTA